MKVNNKAMRDKILELVKKDPTLADDDKRLIANIWWSEGWHDKNLYKNLSKVSSPETIRRTRARLTEEGLIKPSSSATNARSLEEQKIREALENY